MTHRQDWIKFNDRYMNTGSDDGQWSLQACRQGELQQRYQLEHETRDACILLTRRRPKTFHVVFSGTELEVQQQWQKIVEEYKPKSL